MRFLLDIIFGFSHIQHPVLMGKSTDGNVFELRAGSENDMRSVYRIMDVPSYQKIYLKGALDSYKKINSPLYKGFMIDLGSFSDFNSYFKANFNTQGRARNFKRQHKKLYSEVKPSKRIYYEAIDHTTLDLLFDRLNLFLEKRFEQKETLNYEIPFLPLYKEMFANLLPKGNAVIFSLFDKDRPISMGIGFVHGKILYLFNIAYDIEYSRFGLGNQMMVDIVKWCFANDITCVDLGRGDFLHKRKWVNSSYTYTQVDLYDPKKPGSAIKALLSWAKNNCRFHGIKLLKKLKVHQLAKVVFVWRYRAQRFFKNKGKHTTLKERNSN